MMIKKISRLFLLLSMAFFMNATAFAASSSKIVIDNFVIEAPWSRQTPKSAKIAGGYMHLINLSDKDEVLLGGESPICGHIEIHKMEIVNDVMKMRKMENGLLIPSKQDVFLKPGSYHIMFMDLNKPLVKGESIPVTLNFKNRGKVSLSFKVSAMGSLNAPN